MIKPKFLFGSVVLILAFLVLIFYPKKPVGEYVFLVEEHDPHFAMEVLAENLEKNPDLENSCHGVTHEIGNAAFEKYGFKEALTGFEDDICGSGYMHGVTEAYIGSVENPLEAMMTACSENYGACFHGIGHGLLLYYKNDLPKAVAGCDLFQEQEQKVDCSEGIFMQNFNTDTKIHDNAYLKPEDTLYPCRDQEPLYKSACYFYSPRYFLRLNEREYEEAIEVCLLAEPEYVGRCTRGVGSVTMKQNIDDVQFVEKVCQSAPEKYQIDCYAGLTSYYVIHVGSIEEAEKLCPMLDENFQKICRGTVSTSANFFQD